MLEPIQKFVGTIVDVFINPLLALIFGAGLIVFLWGVAQYIYGMNVKGEPSTEGRKHMLWGIVGMFIMSAALAIINIIARTINVKPPL